MPHYYQPAKLIGELLMEQETKDDNVVMFPICSPKQNPPLGF